MSWLTHEQIVKMGFAHVAPDALLSDRASFHNCASIRIGARSRIDDFCVLAAGAGGISIGANVHVAVQCSLIGAGAITLSDFSGLSSRVAIYSSSDDYSGRSLTNPTVPSEFKKLINASVSLGRHVIIGSGTVVLPGVEIADGAAVGSLSLVKKSLEEFCVYGGNPLRKLGERKRDLLDLEADYLRASGLMSP